MRHPSSSRHAIGARAACLSAALLVAALLTPGCMRTKGKDAARILSELELGSEPESAMIRLEAVLAHDPDNCALIQARALLSLRMPADTDTMIARQAATDAIHHCKTTAFLAAGFRDPDASVRARALNVAAGLGLSGMLPSMRYLLEDRDKGVRKAALHTVARLRDHRSRLICLLLLNDPEWSVRAEAANVVTIIGKPADAKRLFRLLDDRDDYVRYEAQEAVIAFCQPANSDIYEAAIRGEHGESARVLAALGVFGRTGPERQDLWDLLAAELSQPTSEYAVRTAETLLERDRERAKPLVRTAAQRASSEEAAKKLQELARQ